MSPSLSPVTTIKEHHRRREWTHEHVYDEEHHVGRCNNIMLMQLVSPLRTGQEFATALQFREAG